MAATQLLAAALAYVRVVVKWGAICPCYNYVCELFYVFGSQPFSHAADDWAGRWNDARALLQSLQRRVYPPIDRDSPTFVAAGTLGMTALGMTVVNILVTVVTNGSC